jgi:4-amino-4-deoxychorismate lyase
MNGLLVNGIASEYVSANDRGLHYGDGLFETIACNGTRAQFIDDHLDRMQRGARILGIEFPDRQLILDDIGSLLDSGSAASVIKLVLTRGRGKRGYRPQEDQACTRICMLGDWPEYIDRWQRDGIAARFCKNRVSVNPGLAGLKTLNRLENVLAASELARDVDEGIMTDVDGQVIEGTMSNLFAVIDDSLVTPDLSRCGIAGIMRAQIIDIAKTNAMKIEIRNMRRDELMSASELFVCNSLIGVCAVRRLEQQVFTADTVTRTIEANLRKRMQADAKAAA